MPKNATFSNEWLQLVFNAVAISGLADDAAVSPLTELSVALHTADPAGGTQATNEIAYTGYSRIMVARTASGWVVSGASVSPNVNIDFGAMASGAGGTVTNFSVGTGVADKLLYSGTVTPNILVVNGVRPRLKSTSTITEG